MAGWGAALRSSSVEDLAARRRGPFIVAAGLIIVICGAAISIPDSFLARLENEGPLTSAQAGWAYRLLAFFAVGQLVYAGYRIFRIERVSDARERDPRFAALSKPDVISSLARNAAALVVFTIVYGIASILITGQLGGFWLFPMLAIAQGAWYYRELGQIASWTALETDPDKAVAQHGAWPRDPPDYCPPIARALELLDTAPAAPE